MLKAVVTVSVVVVGVLFRGLKAAKKNIKNIPHCRQTLCCMNHQKPFSFSHGWFMMTTSAPTVCLTLIIPRRKNRTIGSHHARPPPFAEVYHHLPVEENATIEIVITKGLPHG
ncbi:hypothetical protein QBC41DRAFT_329942 [Cercophora samala]|uniref:Uncharacterized protein n=1 Tax=Cercophora samala TaxID=330535 RepID=A0AA39Z1A4_9PEZI|nr:hypothetical protein QBC41DRAFT_329942 [Cercophora samala]